MNKRVRKVTMCVLVMSMVLPNGCIRAARTGFADGVNSALSSAVESWITNALQPVVGEE